MRFYPLIAAGAMVCSVILIRPTTAAETYELDGAHCDVSFRISHLQLSYTAGRFGDVRGGFVLDPAQPANASFIVQINAASIDTNNAKRDEHLRSPDFFNVKQFPGISFRSTRVQPIQGGYRVSGDLTLHGVTKPLTVQLAGGGAAEFPPGVRRSGFSGNFVIKRSEFGIEKFSEAVGDDVFINVSFEGTLKQ